MRWPCGTVVPATATGRKWFRSGWSLRWEGNHQRGADRDSSKRRSPVRAPTSSMITAKIGTPSTKAARIHSLPFTRSGATCNRRWPFFSRKWARPTKDRSYRAGFLYAVVRRCPANDTDGSRVDVLRRRRFQGIAVAGKTSGSQPCIPMMKPADVSAREPE